MEQKKFCVVASLLNFKLGICTYCSALKPYRQFVKQEDDGDDDDSATRSMLLPLDEMR